MAAAAPGRRTVCVRLARRACLVRPNLSEDRLLSPLPAIKEAGDCSGPAGGENSIVCLANCISGASYSVNAETRPAGVDFMQKPASCHVEERVLLIAHADPSSIPPPPLFNSFASASVPSTTSRSRLRRSVQLTELPKRKRFARTSRGKWGFAAAPEGSTVIARRPFRPPPSSSDFSSPLLSIAVVLHHLH